MSDLKEGACVEAFWFNRDQCCWSSNQTDGICDRWFTCSRLFVNNDPSCAHPDAYFVGYLCYFLFALLFSGVCVLLVRMFAPYACGNGIPEIKTILANAMEDWFYTSRWQKNMCQGTDSLIASHDEAVLEIPRKPLAMLNNLPPLDNASMSVKPVYNRVRKSVLETTSDHSGESPKRTSNSLPMDDLSPSDDKPFTKADLTHINKLLNPRLLDAYDMDVEILRMDPDHPLHSASTFQEMNLKPELLKGITVMGYYKPSRIQEKALKSLISKNPQNMIAQSQSGTGKTATFLMALLSRVDINRNVCQCLCLAPTRELAQQLVSVGRRMARFMDGITFGLAVRTDQETTERNLANTDAAGCVTDHIVVGTPGTVASWLRCHGSYRLDVSNLSVFVLDEADVMMEVEGFLNISMRIKKKLPPNCQILLFSATFEDEIVDFARDFVPDAVEIRVKRTQLALKNIRQFYLEFEDWKQKYAALTDIYGGFDVGQAIIFCATRKEASWLQGKMNLDGHRVSILSGDLDVAEREAVIREFRSTESRVLITTNLCARGLDIPQVNLIVNWNMPTTASGAADCETYLHRIGRSGRFGKEGVAVNLITSDEKYILKELEHHFQMTIPLLTNDDLIEQWA